MARGMSLHVGLNTVDPNHYDGWDGALAACEFDANDMESLAQSRGFETTKLLTGEATADAVLNGIDSAAGELESGDIFFITYSGHGGQVPDGDDEEIDSSDETWVAYDRQIVDDELYELWGKFQPGVRIVVLSDSCHSGSVNKGITNAEPDVVPDPVATAENAAQQDPRFRALPRDKMIATYRANKALYDGIQKRVAGSESTESQLGVTALLISGCKDHQLSRDGFSNGRFTEELKKVWADGGWQGGYSAFHEAIVSGMPDDQTPNYNPVGATNPDFEQQNPFTV
jgi:metacaspase-1